MLIYNTTYHVEEGQEKYFLTWMQEFYLPEVEKHGALYAPRIARILSHIEEGSVCYSVQFEVENSAILHRWHQEQGVKLKKLFWVSTPVLPLWGTGCCVWREPSPK